MIHIFAAPTRLLAVVVASLVVGVQLTFAQAKAVLTTTTIIADTAKLIAGDRVSVEALMGPGIDPHLYKASPGDVRRLLSADLVLYNGLHLEGKLAEVFSKIAETRFTVAVAEAIPHDKLRQAAEFAGNYDPHVWFDVQLWLHAAESISSALTKLDPDGASAYKANFDRAKQELLALDAWCRSELAKIPKERRVLVTAHDAFGYFGRAYDIEVLAIQGVSTDSEASLRDINRLIDTLVDRKIPAVFVESSVPHKTIEALVQGAKARGHTIAIGAELYSDSLGEPGSEGGTYEGMVRHNVGSIVRSLMRLPL